MKKYEKYRKHEEGEWVRPIRKNWQMCCCDCGLVHTIDFKVKNKVIWLRAFRNNRSTGQVRRHMKKDE